MRFLIEITSIKSKEECPSYLFPRRMRSRFLQRRDDEACAISYIEHPIFKRSSPDRASIMLRNRRSISGDVSFIPFLLESPPLLQNLRR